MQCASCGEPLAADLKLCTVCADSRAKYDAGLAGVRGWLAWFCFMVGVLFPIGTLQNIRNFRIAVSRAAARDAWFIAVGNVYTAMFGLLVVAAFVVAYSILRLRPWAPRITTVFLISVPIFTGSLLLVPFAFSWPDKLTQHWQPIVVQSLVSNVLSSLIWLAYFSVSRRVRVNFPPDRFSPDS